MTTSEAALLDTNVLVYAADETSTFHQAAKLLRDKGLEGEIPLCICPQVLKEFFAIVTDPRRVKNPRSREEASAEVGKYLRSTNIRMLYSGPEAMAAMMGLLERYDVTRQDIFDLQLVATMLSNGVSRLFTFNEEDFSKFGEIEVAVP